MGRVTRWAMISNGRHRESLSPVVAENPTHRGCRPLWTEGSHRACPRWGPVERKVPVVPPVQNSGRPTGTFAANVTSMTDLDDKLAPETPGRWWPDAASPPNLWITTPDSTLQTSVSVDPNLHADGAHVTIEVESPRLNLEHRVTVRWPDVEELHRLLGQMINARRSRTSSLVCAQENAPVIGD